jgi:transcription elongation factor Elf1
MPYSEPQIKLIAKKHEKRTGYKNQLGSTISVLKSLAPDLDLDARCEVCNGELSQCGPQDNDGIPTMDCKVCQLRSKIEELEKSERLFRYMLWLRHQVEHSSILYGDDSEMQCSACMIDFKRDTAEHISEVFQAQGVQKLKEYLESKPDGYLQARLAT